MHGIMELDKGAVWGDTWHGLEQYQTFDKAIAMDLAREILNYPLAKRPLFRIQHIEGVKKAVWPVDGAFCIVRTDGPEGREVVIAPSCGSGFEVLQNDVLLDYIDQNLLSQFKELKIESVGTLFNGATSFVNLKLDEFEVKGDKSPTISRLMYYNPLGKGSYKVCAHDIRIVCNNTLRAAEAQGKANDTLVRIAHTSSASTRLETELRALAELKMGLKAHVDVLNSLTTEKVDDEYVDTFLKLTLGLNKDGELTTQKEAQRELILGNFHEGSQTMTPQTAHSRYGLLQAFTNFVDHGSDFREDATDKAAVLWDGITGQRASRKDKALQLLLAPTLPALPAMAVA